MYEYELTSTVYPISATATARAIANANATASATATRHKNRHMAISRDLSAGVKTSEKILNEK